MSSPNEKQQTILSRVQNCLQKGFVRDSLKEKYGPMQRLMVKVLKENMPDVVPFQPKHVKQPVLRSVPGVNGPNYLQSESSLPPTDPGKMRFFDRRRMCEIYLERHIDTLYARVQKVLKEPPTDWETPVNPPPVKKLT